MESEFIALDKPGTEAKWLRNLLIDIPIWKRPAPSMSIHCDNEATIAKAKNKIYNGKSIHIRLRHKIVKQLLDDGIISFDYVRLELNIIDPFIKPLGRKLEENTSRGIGLMSITKSQNDNNPTYMIDELMKYVRMGNNKSFVDLVMHFHYFIIEKSLSMM